MVPALTKEFGYKNVMAVPKIDKISINIGLGEATQNAKLMDGAVNELGADRRPEAGGHQGAPSPSPQFKLREGHVDRLHGDAARRPHVRVFRPAGERGAAARARFPRAFPAKSFDGRGNYTLGVKDQLIFPEIDYAKVEKTKGMNISITTTARTDAEGLALLRQMGMPFRQ